MELKSITEAQQAMILSILTDGQIKKTYMLPDFARPEDAISLFRRLCSLSQKKDRFVRGIYAGDQLVGFLNDVEIQNRSIELGYVIHPAHWNKGYATAALKEAISQLFALGFEEVITGAFAENTASIRVMEKAGMKPLDKTETIEYRGKAHRCIYYRMKR